MSSTNVLEQSNQLNHVLLPHETNYLITVCYISLMVCTRLSTSVCVNCSISIVSQCTFRVSELCVEIVSMLVLQPVGHHKVPSHVGHLHLHD